MLLVLPQKFLVTRQWTSLSLHYCNTSSSAHFEVYKNLTTYQNIGICCFELKISLFEYFSDFCGIKFVGSSSVLGTFESAPLLLPHHVYPHLSLYP